jgi:hypothetical protein
MSDIEPWRDVWICNACDAQQADDASKTCWHCGSGDWEEVPVIRADAHAEAVGRVAELEAELVKMRESRDAWRLQAMREHDAAEE